VAVRTSASAESKTLRVAKLAATSPCSIGPAAAKRWDSTALSELLASATKAMRLAAAHCECARAATTMERWLVAEAIWRPVPQASSPAAVAKRECFPSAPWALVLAE
jgi:hypothetical protein